MNFLPVLGYLLCFGIADCLWVYPNKKYPILLSLTVRSAVTAILFTALFILTHHSVNELLTKNKDVVIAICISSVSYGGLYFYVKSLTYEQVSVIAPVTTILTSLLGVIFSVIFYKEFLTVRVGCCLLAAFTGVVLCFSKNHRNGLKIKFNKGTWLSARAAMCWALSYTFFKTPINKLGVIPFSLILETTILLINLVFLLISAEQKRLTSLSFDKPTLSILIIGGLIFGGTLLNSFSYKLYPLIYLNIFNKIGVIVPVMYSAVILKEKISFVQLIGISLLIISAIITSI